MVPVGTLAIANAMPPITSYDSIAYTISGMGSGLFDTGAFNVLAFAEGVNNSGIPPTTDLYFQNIAFTRRIVNSGIQRFFSEMINQFCSIFY